MAQVIFNLTPADQTRMVDALSVKFGYQPTINGSPNPQTAGEFVRQQIIKWTTQQVREHELNTARAVVTVTDVAIT